MRQNMTAEQVAEEAAALGVEKLLVDDRPPARGTLSAAELRLQAESFAEELLRASARVLRVEPGVVTVATGGAAHRYTVAEMRLALRRAGSGGEALVRELLGKVGT